MTSIANTLGVGSGIDTQQLVKDLAAASKEPKEAAIAKRETLNASKVSTLASVNSNIDSFASALSSLLSGGSLYTQPTSGDASVVSVSAIAGSRLGGLSASLEVKSLATAQTLVSGYSADANAAIGKGSFTLTTPTGAKTITIDDSNNSLAGFARAINAAGAGVTATVVTDTQGARLTIKGQTGAANSFSLALQSGGDAALQAFEFDPQSYDPQAPAGLTRTKDAADADLVLDGVSVKRSTNSFTDLIPGVKVTLNKAAEGTTVAIGTQSPSDAIGQAVQDFVSAFNELKAQLDEATAAKNSDGTGGGPLRGDLGIREMQSRLSKLTTQELVSNGSIKTLAEIGVKTNRDGTLSVNSAQLATALANNPDGVEALFNPAQTSSSPLVQVTSPAGRLTPGTYNLTDLVLGPPASGKINGVDAIPSGDQLIAAASSGAAGLSIQLFGNVAAATITVEPGLGGALKTLRDTLRASNGALATSSTALAAEAKRIAADRDKMELRETAYEEQLSKSFTAMDTRVATLKATQSYLDQQIKVWTNSSN